MHFFENLSKVRNKPWSINAMLPPNNLMTYAMYQVHKISTMYDSQWNEDGYRLRWDSFEDLESNAGNRSSSVRQDDTECHHTFGVCQCLLHMLHVQQNPCIFFIAFLVFTCSPRPFKLNSEAAMRKAAAPGPILQLKGLESPCCRITANKWYLQCIVGGH